jgi:hypothetical protein
MSRPDEAGVTPEAMRHQAGLLLEAQGALAQRSVFDIVDALDAVARGWLDPENGLRREAVASFSGRVDERSEWLDYLFSQLTRPVLLHLLQSDLGDPAILDGFQPRSPHAHGQVRAIGPRLVVHVLPSGPIADIAILSLVSSLLVKSASLTKIATTDSLAFLFLRSLRQTDPVLADACALMTWEGKRTDLTLAAFERADCAVVYGNDETVSSVRGLVPPGVRAIFHGHKLSFGMVARECCTPQTAENVAIDVSAHDQRGCLSPHLFYVESGGACTPVVFAERVADALQRLRLHPQAGSADEATQVWHLRASLPLRGGTVFQSGGNLNWTVLYDPDPTFSVSPLLRTVWIKPVENLEDVFVHLSPVRRHLQAAGFAVGDAMRSRALLESLAKAGVLRVCQIGQMQRPPLTWHHDGRFRLLDLLQMVDWEG